MEALGRFPFLISFILYLLHSLTRGPLLYLQGQNLQISLCFFTSTSPLWLHLLLSSSYKDIGDGKITNG